MKLILIALGVLIAAWVCMRLNRPARNWLHDWMLSLERRGYLIYTERPRGGGGVFEIDKFARPSVEHVQKAMDGEVESQEHDGS